MDRSNAAISCLMVLVLFGVAQVIGVLSEPAKIFHYVFSHFSTLNISLSARDVPKEYVVVELEWNEKVVASPGARWYYSCDSRTAVAGWLCSKRVSNRPVYWARYKLVIGDNLLFTSSVDKLNLTSAVVLTPPTLDIEKNDTSAIVTYSDRRFWEVHDADRLRIAYDFTLKCLQLPCTFASGTFRTTQYLSAISERKQMLLSGLQPSMNYSLEVCSRSSLSSADLKYKCEMQDFSTNGQIRLQSPKATSLLITVLLPVVVSTFLVVVLVLMLKYVFKVPVPTCLQNFYRKVHRVDKPHSDSTAGSGTAKLTGETQPNYPQSHERIEVLETVSIGQYNE